MDKYATAFATVMEAKGIKNADLARHIGSHPSYVSLVKRGKTPLTESFAESAAEMLGVAPETISEQFERKLVAGADLERMGLRAPTAGLPAGHVALELLPGFGPTIEQLTQVVLPQAVVRRKVGFTPIEHIRCAFNPTRAMAPEIEHGALLFLDTTSRNVEDVVDGMVYAYQLYGHADVKRFLLRKQQIHVAGHGDMSDPLRLTDEDRDHLKILGLVAAAL